MPLRRCFTTGPPAGWRAPQPRDPAIKRFRLDQQADDEERLALEVEEIAGMDEDMIGSQQFDHEGFFAAIGGYLQGGRPSTLHWQK